ncbi:MAG: Rne/Rng family ribonuclease [Acidobacteriaceae bacterium]|jgi:ribonuclease G
MSKEIYISSTPHETRLAIVENDALTEMYYERENEYTLAGSIYNGRVTRVLPGMQSSFVDIGLERDAFLYITDFMEEAPDPEEFDTVSSGDRPARAPRQNGSPEEGSAPSEAGGRDRNGRSRRGGRDRNPDRQSASDTSQRGAPRAPESGFVPPPAAPAEGAEAGEGAPGTDGSRRWRGRRGRRRGRGNGGQPGEPVRGGAAPAFSETAPDEEILIEGGSTFDEVAPLDMDASAEPISAVAPDRSERPSHETGQRSDRGENQRGGRRDRGRNDARRRDAERFDAPARDSYQNPDRPQRVPRGFAPSRDLYGVDSGEASRSTGPVANAYPDADSDAASAGEPIVLPGESLSKYRKGSDESPVATAPGPSATVNLAPPANLYTLAEGWDGGATLPGETLSRRRPSESRPESRGEFRPNDRGGQRDFQREGRRDPRFDRNARPNRGPQADTRRDDRAGFRNDSPSTSPETLPAVAAAVSEPIPHSTGEYEPAEASASYRVDPLPRTEYRQAGSILEPLPLEAPEATTELEPDAHETAAAETHDITSINAGGEMFSEPVEALPDAQHQPTPIELSEPASPIRHEGAVVSTERDFDQPAVSSSLSAAAVGSFAPGTGQLDEEIIDDEDFHANTIHASSIEEIDDLEEETLEGAADLGSMIREMSIDHITRTSPESGDLGEDDLEEDELEEDDEDDDEEDVEDQDEETGEEYQLNLQSGKGQSESDSDSDEDFEERAIPIGDAGSGTEAHGEASRDEGQAANPSTTNRESGRSRDAERRPGRRDGRRDGRRGRGDRSDRGDRPRSTGGSGDRERSGNGRGRHSMQSINLPAISDLLKPGQEILVQIAKEPIAKKGARITSHIALPGRFLVFMPTVSHTGVSRKIESDAERRRLKEILLSEKGEASGGFIVRTAAEGASEEELRSDLRFLLNLWADIKARSDSSKSPALIYHDLNLIERILRDQVTDNFSAIWVDTENEYERVLRFLQRFQPLLIRRVKLYLKETPLFEQFGITEEINKALRSKVWLKSGGSIVINQTEALVAIDINTGKFVGKTARLEDTIVKTNLDAIPEIVRQIRLRDLGGIIIIDFIDMDERKNRNRVMAALEDELKNDRAPSKVLQFNDFGLVAITRKRVKQSLERTLSTTCNVCTGTGMVKSPVTVCNDIYIEMRKMHKHLERGDVMLRVNPEVVKQLKTSGAKWLQEMEEMVGKTILVKSDPSLHPEQFDIH